jgi:AraC-like DNA-binding protein
MDDSDLSIDDLAAYMNLSRTQLYRKVKAVTGSSPVELLRTTRLKRAYELLLTTDKSVSEVAYAVGFSAPSYFTKCFKDEYGMVPGEVRKVED